MIIEAIPFMEEVFMTGVTVVWFLMDCCLDDYVLNALAWFREWFSG